MDTLEIEKLATEHLLTMVDDGRTVCFQDVDTGETVVYEWSDLRGMTVDDLEDELCGFIEETTLTARTGGILTGQ